MNNGIIDIPDKALYKCGWSPVDGYQFRSTADITIVNGTVVYSAGKFTTDEYLVKKSGF